MDTVARGIGYVVARRDCDGCSDEWDYAYPVETGGPSNAASYAWTIPSVVTPGLAIAAGRSQAWHHRSKPIR